jgi:hypothetical protein
MVLYFLVGSTVKFTFLANSILIQLLISMAKNRQQNHLLSFYHSFAKTCECSMNLQANFDTSGYFVAILTLEKRNENLEEKLLC